MVRAATGGLEGGVMTENGVYRLGQDGKGYGWLWVRGVGWRLLDMLSLGADWSESMAAGSIGGRRGGPQAGLDGSFLRD